MSHAVVNLLEFKVGVLPFYNSNLLPGVGLTHLVRQMILCR